MARQEEAIRILSSEWNGTKYRKSYCHTLKKFEITELAGVVVNIWRWSNHSRVYLKIFIVPSNIKEKPKSIKKLKRPTKIFECRQ